MRIYQLKTAKEFMENPFVKEQNLTTEQLMQIYAEDVAKRFAAFQISTNLSVPLLIHGVSRSVFIY